MKNIFLKTIGGTALAILMMTMFANISVSAQDKTDGQQTGNLFPEPFGNSKPNIEGVWKTTVTQRNCQTGDPIRVFRGLSTFHQGGTSSEIAAVSSPALRSAGHGIWEKETRTTFSTSFIFLRFNPDGTYAGTQITNQLLTISGRNGNNFDASGTIQIFDANDNLLGSGCATAVGTRFQ